MRILFLGDVFGAPGRRAVESRLRDLRDELEVDVCIVNGENAADGVGITTKLGRLVDLSEVEKAGLERYTNDKGQHVHLEARPAASVSTSG